MIVPPEKIFKRIIARKDYSIHEKFDFVGKSAN